MKNELAIFLNSYQRYSEVFLFRLIEGLSENYNIRLNIFNLSEIQDSSKRPYKITEIKSFKKSLLTTRFYCSLFKLIFIHKIEDKSFKSIIKNAWFLSIILSIKAEKIYFPFIGMLREFSEILPYLKNKVLFTSIRGTDITVTPYLQERVIEKYKQIYPFLNSIHYLSPHLKKIANEYGLNHPNEIIIHQGVKFQASISDSSVSSNSNFKVITIARLHYIKGIEFGILAIRELVKRGLELSYVIIGDGPQKDYLQYLVKREKLEKVVTFRGPLSEKEIFKEIEYASLLLHPHMVEGLSNTMLESIVLGKKVVTFESNIKQYNLKELEESIIEVEKYDFKLMADSIMNLYKNNDFQVSKNNRDYIMNAFSIQKHISLFSDFFKG